MGFRWRKSKSLGKFLRLNFTRKGVGVSVGPRTGLGRFNISPTGRKSVSASVPGTGLSYNHRIDNEGTETGEPSPDERPPAATEASAPGAPPPTGVAGELSRNGIRSALTAAGLRLAVDDEAGFGVREPDDEGVIRAFWINGDHAQREAQVPFGAEALRNAGYNARVIRLDGSYPGIIIKPE